MKVFLDANILVSVLNKEYPVFTYTSRILSLNHFSGFELFTSPICLAIAFYFSQKKYNGKVAKQKISVLAQNITIAPASSTSVSSSLSNPKVNDFEDGLEYYAAIENNCNCIITEDENDFYFSEIEVLNSQNFFLKYMVKK